MKRLGSTILMAATCLLLCLSSLSAREGDPAEGRDKASPLTGAIWNLAELSGGFLASDLTASIEFLEDGRMGGHDGCNAYRGRYTSDGHHLAFSEQMLVTRMVCPEPLASRTIAYSVALSKASKFEIEKGQLILRSEAGAFLARFSAEPEGLAGTSWSVTAYDNGQRAMISVLPNTELTTRFEEDRVSGHAGCNTFSASLEIQGLNLSIEPTASTRKYCGASDSIMEQESAFLEALRTATTYRFNGRTLELLGADGALAVSYGKSTPDD